MRTKVGVIVGCACAILLAFASYFATRPTASFEQLRHAIARQDRVAMDRLVDFSSVRESVKQRLRLEIAESVTASKNPLAVLGAIVAEKLLDPIVEAVITPSGIAWILAGQRVSDASKAPPTDGQGKPAIDQMKFETSWDGLSRYTVTTKNQNARSVTLVLQRTGLFEWRLTEIR